MRAPAFSFGARRPARGPQPTGLLDNRLLTTLQGELTGTRLLVIVRLTAVSKRLVVLTLQYALALGAGAAGSCGTTHERVVGTVL